MTEPLMIYLAAPPQLCEECFHAVATRYMTLIPELLICSTTARTWSPVTSERRAHFQVRLIRYGPGPRPAVAGQLIPAF